MPALAEKIRMLGNYGSEERYVHRLQGSEQPPLTRCRPPCCRSNWVISKPGTTAAATSPGATPRPLQTPGWSSLPRPRPLIPSGILYVVRTGQRDALQAHLAEAGGANPDSTTPVRRTSRAPIAGTGHSLPVAEQLAREVLSLPIGPHLTDDQVDRVITAVKSFP